MPHSKSNFKKKTTSGKHASDVVESAAAEPEEASEVELPRLRKPGAMFTRVFLWL